MVPTGCPLDHLVESTPKVVFFASALIESESIAYNERHTVRFPYELDTNLHQANTDALNRDLPLFLALSSVCPLAKHNIPRRRESVLPIAPHLLQSYDVTPCVLASLQYHVGVAYAVRALESECVNVERTHDELPCSRSSPCTCANFLSSPLNPPASPPLLPSVRFPPFHPPFFPGRVFPPLRLPSPSPVVA